MCHVNDAQLARLILPAGSSFAALLLLSPPLFHPASSGRRFPLALQSALRSPYLSTDRLEPLPPQLCSGHPKANCKLSLSEHYLFDKISIYFFGCCALGWRWRLEVLPAANAFDDVRS